MKSSFFYRTKIALGRALPLVILTIYAMIALFPREGIESLSLNPDTVVATWLQLGKAA